MSKLDLKLFEIFARNTPRKNLSLKLGNTGQLRHCSVVVRNH